MCKEWDGLRSVRSDGQMHSHMSLYVCVHPGIRNFSYGKSDSFPRVGSFEPLDLKSLASKRFVVFRHIYCDLLLAILRLNCTNYRSLLCFSVPL